MKSKLLFLAFGYVTAFSWMRTYDNAIGYTVKQTQDDGYFVAGWGWQDSSGIAEELLLLKTDSEGNEQWRSYYTGETGAVGHCGQQTSDGGYIVVGEVFSYSGYIDLWLLKTNGKGDTVWAKTYGKIGREEVGRWVEETKDGGYIITGTYGESNDLWLLKTDKDGDTLWTRIYGICSYGYQVHETEDGYIMATNYGLVKTNFNGDTVWTNTYGSNCVRETSDGGYILAKSRNKDVWIVKTDSAGDTLWTKTYGGSAEEYGYDIQQTTDGGYIITGSPWTLIKTDQFGDTLWTQKSGAGLSVDQTKDGGYIICSARYDSLLLIKTDSLGYAGIEEPVTKPAQTAWQVVSPVGSTATLRYSNLPKGFHAFVFDASGRKVDEMRSQGESGTITWGQGVSAGVYFVRVESSHPATKKIILIK